MNQIVLYKDPDIELYAEELMKTMWWISFVMVDSDIRDNYRTMFNMMYPAPDELRLRYSMKL